MCDNTNTVSKYICVYIYIYIYLFSIDFKVENDTIINVHVYTLVLPLHSTRPPYSTICTKRQCCVLSKLSSIIVLHDQQKKILVVSLNFVLEHIVYLNGKKVLIPSNF